MHMHLNSQSFKPHQGTPLTAAPAAQGETSPNVVRACAREPTPSPSQEGSNTGWPVPLLGGVRGGLVGAWFMGMGQDARCLGDSDVVGIFSARCVPLPEGEGCRESRG